MSHVCHMPFLQWPHISARQTEWASVGTLACLLVLLHVHCCPTMRRQLHCSSCLPRCRPICEWALSGREGRCQTCSRLGDAAARAQSQVAAYRALQLHAAWPRPHSPCASHPVPATGAHNSSAHRSNYQQYLGLITLPTILTPSTVHTIISRCTGRDGVTSRAHQAPCKPISECL